MGDFKVEGNHASDNATVIKSGKYSFWNLQECG